MKRKNVSQSHARSCMIGKKSPVRTKSEKSIFFNKFLKKDLKSLFLSVILKIKVRIYNNFVLPVIRQ